MIKEYEFGSFTHIEILRVVGTGVEVNYLTLADGVETAREGIYTIDPYELNESDLNQLTPKENEQVQN